MWCGILNAATGAGAHRGTVVLKTHIRSGQQAADFREERSLDARERGLHCRIDLACFDAQGEAAGWPGDAGRFVRPDHGMFEQSAGALLGVEAAVRRSGLVDLAAVIR